MSAADNHGADGSVRLAYTVPEVARMMAVSERTVYEATRSGALPTLPESVVGKRTLIPAHGLAERIAEMAS